MAELILPSPLFTPEKIAARIKSLAEEIAEVPQKPDIAMPILVGGFIFAADLVRALARKGVELDVEMLWLRSYGDKRSASAISLIAGPSERIAGRRVLIIDGVLDFGRTIEKARSLIEAAGAASVRVAVLLDKQRPGRLLQAEHVGFRIGGDQFVVGYGMDDAGRYRGLPYIGVAN